MEEKTKEVLKRIKEARIKKGITQAQVAETMGVTQATYKNIEKGISALKMDTLIKISEILSLDLAELLGFNQKEEKEENEETVLVSIDEDNLKTFLIGMFQTQTEQSDNMKSIKEDIKELKEMVIRKITDSQ